MMGMVLARDRICLTSRYLSYRGFITWRSFLVTWKARTRELRSLPLAIRLPAVPACSGLTESTDDSTEVSPFSENLFKRITLFSRRTFQTSTSAADHSGNHSISSIAFPKSKLWSLLLVRCLKLLKLQNSWTIYYFQGPGKKGCISIIILTMQFCNQFFLHVFLPYEI